MTEKRFKLTDIGFVRSNGKSKEIGIVTNEGEFIELKKIVEVMNELYEENQALKKKIGIMADAFVQSNDLIEVEQVFYTKVCEPSEYYDEETLSEITNDLLGSDVE